MKNYSWNEAPWLDNEEAMACTKIVINDGITSIGDHAFTSFSKLTTIQLPAGITSIGEYAFYECDNLSEISLPDSVTSIGGNAFKDCSSLSSAEFGENLTSIGESAFSGCSSLSSVKMKDNVNSIGERAFQSCTSLPSVLITAKTVGKYAFIWCDSLTRVFFTDRLTAIGEDAFYDCNLKNVYYNGSSAKWNSMPNTNVSPLSSATKKFDFDPYKVDSVTLDKPSFYLGKGNTGILTATIFPETATNTNVTWKVDDESVVKKTENGLKVTLEGLKKGETTITVTTEDQGKTAKCELEVGNPVTSVSFSANSKIFDLGVDKERQLEWTITPEDAGNKNVSFKSDAEDIVTVDQKGLTKALSTGQATITITTEDGSYTDTCKINAVQDVEVTELKLKPEKLLLAPKDSEEISVTVIPDNATDKEVEWSVDDPTVATVEDNGNGKATVTAVAEGTAKVTVTPKNKTGYYSPSATCTVTVWKGSVTLTKNNRPLDSLIIGINETEQLGTDIPYGTVFDSTNWSVSDNNIASIDGSGYLTGVAAGETTAVFSGTLNGKTYEASCPVKVWKGAVSISPKAQTVKLGETAEIKMDEIPAFLKANVSWQASDTSIITIDEKGVITGKALGETTVTLMAVINGNTYTDYCTVTVERRRYGDDPNRAIAGAKMDVAALLNPKGVFSGKYTSSNKKVAAVKKTGLLTPKNAGTVTINLEQNGTSVSSCEITVDKPAMVKKAQVSVGQYGLNAFDYLTGTEYAPTEWQSTKTGVATVDTKTGDIKALGKGTTKIIAVYGSGTNSSKKKYKITLKVK